MPNGSNASYLKQMAVLNGIQIMYPQFIEWYTNHIFSVHIMILSTHHRAGLRNCEWSWKLGVGFMFQAYAVRFSAEHRLWPLSDERFYWRGNPELSYFFIFR